MEETPPKEYEILNSGFNEKGDLYFDIRAVMSKEKCSVEIRADISKSKLVNNPLFNYKLILMPDDTFKLARTIKEGMGDDEVKQFMGLLK